MAYFTFQSTDKGVPVLTPTQPHRIHGFGEFSAWRIAGQTDHRQSYSGTSLLKPPLVILVPSTIVKPIGAGAQTSGNYKTFQARGGADSTSPPTQ